MRGARFCRRRLIALAVVGALVVLAAPADAKAPEQPFTWSAISRFAGDRTGDTRLDSGIGDLPVRLTDHPVLIEPTRALCRRAETLRWRVDGRPRTLRLVTDRASAGGCRAMVVVRDQDRRPGKPHRIEVNGGNGFRAVSLDTLRDLLVVALGDSVASGEGNPLRDARRPWLEQQCHRSVAAGFEQASRLLAQGLKHQALTFVSLACSGASVDAGLLRDYGGIDPQPGDLDLVSQVERLRRLDAVRPVRAVLVSAGANDVHFGDAVVHCMTHRRCWDARFDPEGRGTSRSADAELVAGLQRLARRYDRLGARLRPIVGPEQVLVSEYFDPTRGSDGRFCASPPGISADEMRWAATALLGPLNAELSSAAVRNGWSRVSGIATDFERHGYCAPGSERWIRTLPESVIRQPGAARASGTLHPNEAGQLAIADRVTLRLARTLGVTPVKRDPGGDDGPPWDTILEIVGILLLLALLAGLVWRRSRRWLFGIVGRLALVATPSHRLGATPGQAPSLPAFAVPESWIKLVVQSAGAIAAVLVSAAFVSVVGAAILWVRYWALHVPPSDAIAVIPNSDFIAVGAQALILFAVLGLVAVFLVWTLDAAAANTKATRRGLSIVLTGELVAAVWLADFPTRQLLQVLAGLLIGVLLLHVLVDQAQGRGSLLRSGASYWVSLRRRLGRFVRRAGETSGPGVLVWLLRVLPLVALLAAVAASTWTHELDRPLLMLPLIAVAALLFVLPGGIAGAASRSQDPDLDPPRVALSAAGVACLAIVAGRDEAWLLAAWVVAGVLAGLCLLIAAATDRRFLPYGLAVLVSVPIFGAAATILRTYDSPEAQPAAAIATDFEHSACGLYVATTDDRVYLARVDLNELGEVRRPESGLSRLTWFPRKDIAAAAVGPLQPVARAQARALTLRDELLRAAGGKRTAIDSMQSCAAREPVAPFVRSAQRRLAERFQPELVLDRRDGFWPVPVRTLFTMQDRRARACREIDGGDLCVGLNTQGDLPWSGGDGEWIEFPAVNRVDDQHRLLVDALRSSDPARSAREYFLVTGGRREQEPVSIQYWFFYTYNSQPVSGTSAGHHEGDFESVGVLLSARTHQPRYVWMARHADEGRMFTWDEAAVERQGEHPTVFVAKGSHASYESCYRKARPLAPAGLIDDHPACDADRQLRLAYESTPLTDLSRVPWGCWRGLFGHRPGDRAFERIPYLEADAPRSPLWQQRFDGVRSEPCRGVRDPGRRDHRGEEVLPERTSARLRAGAGRLDPLVDECADWYAPPPAGTYLVACDPQALRRYVGSGLESAGPPGVHIDTAGARAPATGPLSVPAVRRNATGLRLDEWRIATFRATTADVYGSCTQGDARLEARFRRVALDPHEPLRLDDARRTTWWLRQEDGTPVASAEPRVAHGRLGDRPLACGGR